MRFRVSRASIGDERPVDGAEYAGRLCGGRLWEVEIESLDDLVALTAEDARGIIVTGASPSSGGFPSIVIYDDWTE